MPDFLTSSLCATQRSPQFRVEGVNVVTCFYFRYKKNIAECTVYFIWQLQNTYTYLAQCMQNSDIPQYQHT